jgi:hypothetical protein
MEGRGSAGVVAVLVCVVLLNEPVSSASRVVRGAYPLVTDSQPTSPPTSRHHAQHTQQHTAKEEDPIPTQYELFYLHASYAAYCGEGSITNW